MLALLAGTLCLTASAGEDLTKLEAKLAEISDTIVRATLDGDTEAILSYYTDDVVLLPSYHPMIRGKDEVARYEKERNASGFAFESMDFTTLDVWTAKDMVYQIGEYGVSFSAPGLPGSVADQGKYMTVWQKQRDGSLKIKVDMWNSDLNPWQPGGGFLEAAEVAGVRKEAAEVAGVPQNEAESSRKCEHDAEVCVEKMAAYLREKGVIGLDGNWENDTGGYRVKSYAEGTTAKSAGVLPGDLLVKVNGIPLADQEAYAKDGAVLRDGSEHTMDITFMPITEQMIAEEIGRHMLEAHLN
jgi:ketosteroid isomerase-like protein